MMVMKGWRDVLLKVRKAGATQVFQLSLIILHGCVGLVILVVNSSADLCTEILPEREPFDVRSKGGRVMSDLRADVANALYWDLAIPRYRVTAEVDHGLVTLQGVVERAYQRSCAEAIVHRVPGVRNEIAVRAVQEFNQATVSA